MTKRKRVPRAERAEGNRKALFRAAAKVVGAVGYKKASIARITQAAGLAQGTFYLYFESRQDLFNQLLPELGSNILAHLSEEVPAHADILEAEREWFRSLITYFIKNPGFFTILNETESVSVSALKTHVQNLVRAYTRTLLRYVRSGQIAPWTEAQLEIISIILISARAYVYQYYLRGKKDLRQVPDEIVDTYVALLEHGIRGARPARSDTAPRLPRTHPRRGDSAP
jgi:AcrR family transcriptional regulator